MRISDWSSDVCSSDLASYVYGALVALAILLALAAYLTLSRTVLRPLKKVGAYFDHIAAGDLTLRIDAANQNEIGALYMALKRMQDSLARIVGTVRAGIERKSTRLNSSHYCAHRMPSSA